MTVTSYAHPRGWIKGEPLLDPQSRPVAVCPVRISNMDPVPPDVATILSFTTVAARDEWLKWWSKTA